MLFFYEKKYRIGEIVDRQKAETTRLYDLLYKNRIWYV